MFCIDTARAELVALTVGIVAGSSTFKCARAEVALDCSVDNSPLFCLRLCRLSPPLICQMCHLSARTVLPYHPFHTRNSTVEASSLSVRSLLRDPIDHCRCNWFHSSTTWNSFCCTSSRWAYSRRGSHVSHLVDPCCENCNPFYRFSADLHFQILSRASMKPKISFHMSVFVFIQLCLKYKFVLVIPCGSVSCKMPVRTSSGLSRFFVFFFLRVCSEHSHLSLFTCYLGVLYATSMDVR